MRRYDRDIQDVYAVKQLGDAIGYGHLMAIAHELWARHLEDKGLPRSGAHCVVGYPMVKEEYQTEALNDPIYTIVVDKALADRKTENSSEKPNNCEDFFREPTAEERKAVADYIGSISVPTGVNIFDLMDESQTERNE